MRGIPAPGPGFPVIGSRGPGPGWCLLPFHCLLFFAMPSEQSFMDRLGRFTSLKDACAGFTPAYAPGATDITSAAQVALLTLLNNKCVDLEVAETDLKGMTDDRVTAVKMLKELATRAVNRVKCNREWAAKLANVKVAADRVRGMKVPRAQLPPPPVDPEAEPPPRRDRGGQSYRDLEGHVTKLIAALQKVTGYDTGAPPDIQIGHFESLRDHFRAGNDTIAQAEVDLRELQLERLRLFASKKPLPDGSASLRDRWARIKSAVKAQYGTSSEEYALVAPIKY